MINEIYIIKVDDEIFGYLNTQKEAEDYLIQLKDKILKMWKKEKSYKVYREEVSPSRIKIFGYTPSKYYLMNGIERLMNEISYEKIFKKNFINLEIKEDFNKLQTPIESFIEELKKEDMTSVENLANLIENSDGIISIERIQTPQRFPTPIINEKLYIDEPLFDSDSNPTEKFIQKIIEENVNKVLKTKKVITKLDLFSEITTFNKSKLNHVNPISKSNERLFEMFFQESKEPISSRLTKDKLKNEIQYYDGETDSEEDYLGEEDEETSKEVVNNIRRLILPPPPVFFKYMFD
jgi:hypothetical protein